MMILEINHKHWEVKKVPSNDPLLYYDGGFSRGATWCGNQIIALSDDLNLYTAPTVILHELSHAFLASTQVSVPESFSEEQVCNFVADYSKQILEMASSVYQTLYVKEADNQ